MNGPEDYRRKQCRYCGAELPPPFLKLGPMALANSFLTREEARQPEFECPLDLTLCPVCRLVQLTHVVPAEKMFSHYLYVSSTTQTFRTHFADYARSVRAKIFKKTGGVAVDIGSNDGLLVACYEKEGFTGIGIEPAKNLSDDANRRGIYTIHDYFGERSVKEILGKAGPADVISGNNVFAHIDDTHGVLRNVSALLDPQGIFVIEFPYLGVMFEKMFFDMIYHEHLSYIAVAPLRHVLGLFGLEIFDIEEVSSHGGSLRVYIQKKGAGRPVALKVTAMLADEARKGYDRDATYEDFAKRVYKVREELIRFVTEAKAGEKTISGYGAPAKATTIINFCRLGPREIDYVVDDNPLKQDRLVPGAKIPVVPRTYLSEHPTDFIVIFAWNFAPEIMKKLGPEKQKGIKFIIPLPSPSVV